MTKALILYSLFMVAANGSSKTIETGVTADQCYALAMEKLHKGNVKSGTGFECLPEGRDA